MRSTRRYCTQIINSVIAVIVILAVVCVSVAYIKAIEKRVSEETNQYLDEGTIQSAALIRQKFDDAIENLVAMAATIGATDLPLNDPQVMEGLREADESLSFENLSVSGPDGVAYEVKDGVVCTFSVGGKEHFQHAIAGIKMISNPTVPLDNSEESIVLSVPVYRKGEIIGVLMGRYFLTDLVRLLDVDTFGGQGYSYIARRSGEVFVTANCENADKTLKNINTDFKDSYFEDRYALEAMQANMQENKSGSVTYVWNGTKQIMRYMPVGINDWYLLSVVPNEVAASRAAGLVRLAALFCCILFGVFSVVTIYALNVQRRKNAELRKAQQDLETNERRYEIVMAQSKDIIYEWDIQTGHIYHSEMFRKQFGYGAPSEHFPQSAVDENYVYEEDTAVFLETYQKIIDGEPYAECEFRIYDVHHCPLWYRSRISLIADEDGVPSRAIGILMDIDEEKKEKEKIMEVAEKDFLTQTFNRGASESRIHTWLKENMGVQHVGLMVIDIDDFKRINDTFGHTSGDCVLREITKEISAIFRETDIVGRIGGDEFVVLMKNIQEPEAAAKKAEEIIRIFEDYRVGIQKRYTISGSIGIALFPEDAATYEALFEKADKALYYAKAHGKNQFVFYEDGAVKQDQRLMR